MTTASTAIDGLGARITREVDAGGAIPALCERIAAILREELATHAFDDLFAGHQRSFVAWHDTQRGTIVNASVHQPRHQTPAHDHAEAWAVYGAYRGPTGFKTFDRAADRAPGLASLVLADERVLQPPEVAIVLPGQVHANWNASDEIVWNLVVRTRPLDDCWRRAFDLATGTYRTMRKPV